ncbi:hypothetical protein SAMN05216184_101449 [Georgenia satyanarayanai]|uniref:Integral membrane protein n=1 Tax=Georgenia satyanarayanai TaxID=860221 RepID=A0A2Y9A3K7_9MICO|nr:hypothetical protein [Georgenia satyanarayanai]PYG01984.1 hypothetical protein A8987_101449 [Georgenia satyanarayanai]SSA36787.1 hypothetical protein SAMN05216184_101449 [Georgenia satyanarayanai]
MSKQPVHAAPATDDRPPARGAGLLVVAVYVVFALAASARAGVQLVRDAAEAPLAYGLSAFAALVYVAAAVALAHNGRRMRRLAWTAVTIELLGVVAVGILSVAQPGLFPRDTVWSHFGSGYGYVPLVLPVLGLFWLWRSSPGRVARANEGR